MQSFFILYSYVSDILKQKHWSMSHHAQIEPCAAGQQSPAKDLDVVDAFGGCGEVSKAFRTGLSDGKCGFD